MSCWPMGFVEGSFGNLYISPMLSVRPFSIVNHFHFLFSSLKIISPLYQFNCSSVQSGDGILFSMVTLEVLKKRSQFDTRGAGWEKIKFPNSRHKWSFTFRNSTSNKNRFLTVRKSPKMGRERKTTLNKKTDKSNPSI